jgi:hypothetical protein
MFDLRRVPLDVPADALDDTILEALHLASLHRNRQMSELQFRGDCVGRRHVTQPHLRRG